jgi:hypothetical protein
VVGAADVGDVVGANVGAKDGVAVGAAVVGVAVGALVQTEAPHAVPFHEQQSSPWQFVSVKLKAHPTQPRVPDQPQ